MAIRWTGFSYAVEIYVPILTKDSTYTVFDVFLEVYGFRILDLEHISVNVAVIAAEHYFAFTNFCFCIFNTFTDVYAFMFLSWCISHCVCVVTCTVALSASMDLVCISLMFILLHLYFVLTGHHINNSE